MKKRLVHGLLAIVLGLLIAIGPKTIFHVCAPEKGSDMVMKCFWSGRAELGLGILLAIIGLIILLSSSKEFRAGLSAASIGIGVVALLIPNVLIGVCGGEHMHCHAVALPALSILSAAAIIVNIAALVSLIGNKK